MGCRAACKVSYYHRIPRGDRTETWPRLIGGSRRRDKLLRITRHSDIGLNSSTGDVVGQKSLSGKLGDLYDCVPLFHRRADRPGRRRLPPDVLPLLRGQGRRDGGAFRPVRELLLSELAKRPRAEPPLVAIRNALVPAVEAALAERDLVRYSIRLLCETSVLRRAIMERRNRLEERIAALMARRLGAARDDNTPMLLAFVTRALHDTAFNAWYDHETDDIAGLVDDLVDRLRAIVAAVPAPPGRQRKAARKRTPERTS